MAPAYSISMKGNDNMKKLFDVGCFTVCKIDNDYMVLEYDGLEYLHRGYFRTEVDAIDYCNNYYQ